LWSFKTGSFNKSCGVPAETGDLKALYSLSNNILKFHFRSPFGEVFQRAKVQRPNRRLAKSPHRTQPRPQPVIRRQVKKNFWINNSQDTYQPYRPPPQYTRHDRYPMRRYYCPAYKNVRSLPAWLPSLTQSALAPPIFVSSP